MNKILNKVYLIVLLIWVAGNQSLLAQEISTDEISRLNQEIKDQLFKGPKHNDTLYSFNFPHIEKSIAINDTISLNSLLFKSSSPKGLIFYLHGSVGDLGTWGKIASLYTQLNYDLLMIDYRGYGKSNGEFLNENQWYSDMQIVYDSLKKLYPENKIIILGHSIGTAAASFLAANNKPKLLILQAPFYSFEDWLHSLDPNANASLFEFKLENYKHIQSTVCPIYVFHGDNDKAVYYGSSLKLKKLFKNNDQLIILKNEDHNDFSRNIVYKTKLKEIL